MTAADRPVVLMHFDHGRSPESWRAAHQAGKVFEQAPYGYHYAAPHVELLYTCDALESRGVRTARRALAWALGFDIVHAWRNRHRLRTADVVWTHTEHEFLADALLKRLHLLPQVRILGESIWLWDEWHRMSALRRGAYRWLLAAVDVHTTHSRLNAAFAAEVLDTRVHRVPPGNEPSSDLLPLRDRAAAAPIRVLSLGNDRHRDWKVLAEATRANADLETLVLSRRRSAARAARGIDRVQVRAAHGIADILQCTSEADVVVVPLKPNGHASGITVAFESIVAGRAVVATRAGGLRDFFGDDLFWAEPGDPASLADAIRRAATAGRDPEFLRRARAHLTERGLTARDYGLRHVVLTQHLLGHDVDVDAASALRPVRLADPAATTAPPGADGAGGDHGR